MTINCTTGAADIARSFNTFHEESDSYSKLVIAMNKRSLSVVVLTGSVATNRCVAPRIAAGHGANAVVVQDVKTSPIKIFIVAVVAVDDCF